MTICSICKEEIKSREWKLGDKTLCATCYEICVYDGEEEFEIH